MRKLLLRALVFAAVFSPIWLIANSISAVSSFDLQIHNWGWVALGAGLVGGTVAYHYFASFVAGFLGDAAVTHPISRVLWRVFGYCCFAGIVVAVAKVLPAYVTLSDNIALYTLFGAMGLGFAIADIVDEKLGLDDTKTK